MRSSPSASSPASRGSTAPRSPGGGGDGPGARPEAPVSYSASRAGRLHRTLPGGGAEPVTPEGATRYADISLDAGRSRLICVREDHRGGGVPANEIVAVPLGTEGSPPAEPVVLVSGDDFYGPLRLRPDGRRLAWLT